MNELSEERFRSLTRLFYFDRDPESIKNDYGKALLIGSSSSYPLSILIASLLAEKTGAGYIALSSPSSVSKVIQNRMPLTEIYVPMEGEGDDFSSLGLAEKVSPFSSVLFGNGVKESGNNKLFLEQLLKTAKGTLVLDAGALALLSSSPEILKERNPSLSVVLTPHLGEAKKLLKSGVSSRNGEDYLEEALSFAETYGVDVLLKSSKSYLVAKDGSTYAGDSIPTPSLAKAGSGDGLAGYLVGLLAYGRKEASLEEIILYADSMIHKAARAAENELGPGLASILSVPQCLPSVVLQEKKPF